MDATNLVIHAFSQLFAGNPTAYGNADLARCVRVEVEPKWDDLWQQHCLGHQPIGIYPMNLITINGHRTWMVRWGCIDLDVRTDTKPAGDYATPADAADKADDLVNVLDALGITAWAETTRSAGQHVWVFAEGWVPARTMRRALLAACDIADASTREVNPKQETLSDGQLGNFVRLPYPHGEVTDATRHALRQVCRRNAQVVGLADFALLAIDRRCTFSALKRAADMYREPIQYSAYVNTNVMSYATIRNPKEQAFWQTVISGGPLGEDRSAWLARVARIAHKRGSSPEETRAILDLADQAIDKYVGRPDRDKRLDELVALVFS